MSRSELSNILEMAAKVIAQRHAEECGQQQTSSVASVGLLFINGYMSCTSCSCHRLILHVPCEDEEASLSQLL
jgi:hypothetical protein